MSKTEATSGNILLNPFGVCGMFLTLALGRIMPCFLLYRSHPSLQDNCSSKSSVSFIHLAVSNGRETVSFEPEQLKLSSEDKKKFNFISLNRCNNEVLSIILLVSEKAFVPITNREREFVFSYCPNAILLFRHDVTA
jgi:hypothetical protein